MTTASERPFTRLAASLRGPKSLAALDRGDCPICEQPIGPFRDELSEKEYAISGMCQECQDSVFKIDPDEEYHRQMDD